MNFTPKTKKVLIGTYILFLALGAIYARSVINSEEIEVEQKQKEEKAFDVKPTKVTLLVQNGQASEEYTARLQNVDSVLDLLEELRKSQGFLYEKTYYIHGTELNSVNRVPASTGYLWKVYYEDKDITYEIADWKLEDGKVYKLKLVKI